MWFKVRGTEPQKCHLLVWLRFTVWGKETAEPLADVTTSNGWDRICSMKPQTIIQLELHASLNMQIHIFWLFEQFMWWWSRCAGAAFFFFFKWSEIDFGKAVGASGGNHMRMITHRQLPDERLRRLGGTQAHGKVAPFREISKKRKRTWKFEENERRFT